MDRVRAMMHRAVLLNWAVMVILANPGQRSLRCSRLETRRPLTALRDLIPATTSQERAPIEDVMKAGGETSQGDQSGNARAGSQSVVAARRRLGDRKCLTKRRGAPYGTGTAHSATPTAVRGYLLDRASLSRLLDTLLSLQVIHPWISVLAGRRGSVPVGHGGVMCLGMFPVLDDSRCSQLCCIRHRLSTLDKRACQPRTGQVPVRERHVSR